LSEIKQVNLMRQASYKSFIAVAAFSLLVNILMLTVPLYMLQIFDRVLASHSTETLIYLTIIAVVALLVLGMLDVARSRVLVRVGRWLDNQLGPLALNKAPDEVLQGGVYASQSLRDIASIRGFLSSPSIFALFDAPWVPVYLLVVFFLHPLLGIIIAVGVIILFCLALLNENLTSKILAQANQQHLSNTQNVDRTLMNSEVIQSMGMLPQIVKRWFTENESILSLQSLASDRGGLILSISKVFRLWLQLGMLGTGAYLVIQNEITPGVMIAASIIGARALAPIEQTIGTWKQWKATRRAYARLMQYFQQHSKRGKGMELPEPLGKIKVENITYIPPGTKNPIIQGINFALEPGEVLALIGPSGSGKSTLARLMLGIWKPFSGAARLDGADVYEWERTQFGKKVGYLPQNVDLFSGSIKENIARLSESDDESVIQAAKMAGAHELILQLPGGYDFDINMFNLSGGQRQRIALARAFYGNPCFIILDEPNSNLDREGEDALVAAIENAKKKQTTMVIISHREPLVQYAHKVMILSQGRVQAYGPRDEVLASLQEHLQKEQQKGD